MRPIIIGITGGIASGKSTLSKLLYSEGYSVISTDRLGHEVLLLPEIKNKLSNEFGKEIFEKDQINRDLLRNIVFKEKSKIDQLNRIVHPEIFKSMDDIVNHSSAEYVFFEIPLLFETHLEKCFDFIILVYTDREIQIKRLIERNSYSEEHATAIIDSQMPLNEKISKSDLIIENNYDKDHLNSQAWDIVKNLPKLKRKDIRKFSDKLIISAKSNDS
ncbi:MAG TPA: dephospho-CoA kinase [Candidatus Cloacimonadota bacterium]|jgi:dephospho-CoA kinase|nr:dephospho-CoA kinase [Candidatus Cloacimonadales bacterium]HPY96362.1 dephospho-CoA kinase [Candidatus Cloacimonadota bacterium]HQB40705.1 dephospho-CoA kinase [Candidatus Cloacimonadota bacterium]